MDRSKRVIKTPKRFDEAFKPPDQPLKNVIKVKLSKVKPRVFKEPENVTKEPAAVKDVLAKDPAKETIKEIVKERPKEAAKERAPKETVKERTVKESVKERSKEVVKERIEKPVKEPAPPKETFEIVRPYQIYRHRTKRPRTPPPVFTDLIPNVVLPFWDARTAAEDHEDDNVKELVHCHCGFAEELGLMVQCETCLTWQHAHCLGIEKPEDAPDGYTCKACSDPKFARESMKWAYDQDWMTKGRMKKFYCDSKPVPEQKAETLRKINLLIERVLNIHQMIHSLRVKQKILANAADDDTDLKLFRNPWLSDYQQHEPVSSEVSPDDCRANLKNHIQQVEELLGNELAKIEEEMTDIEKSSCKHQPSIESLKNNLQSMQKYIVLTKSCNKD